MKRLVYLLLWVLFINALVGCVKSKPNTSGMINPGDKVGDFLITTSKLGEVTFMWELDATHGQEANTTFTEVPAGTKLIATVGIYDDTFSGKLDENWSDLSYELYISDRQVNLSAFGTIETKHPIVGTMRHHNVVIVAEKPGKITLRSKTIYKGKSEESYDTYIFLPPDNTGINFLQPKTSQQAKLSYLLYLPEYYGMEVKQ
jgi:hypothetical protein